MLNFTTPNAAAMINQPMRLGNIEVDKMLKKLVKLKQAGNDVFS